MHFLHHPVCRPIVGAISTSQTQEHVMRHLTHLNYIDIVAREGSIRKAADRLAITSTALNRRILALEDEVGSPLFERLPTGVRLNTAGELFIQHIRSQMTDLSRVLSQISDLSGIRRGHVKVSAASEVINHFLPSQIGLYRAEHPAVSFEVMRHNADEALSALSQYDADLALICAPVLPQDIQINLTVSQPLMAIMHHTHPLASSSHLQLEQLQAYPVIMPETKTGIRAHIDVTQLRKAAHLVQMITSDDYAFIADYLRHEQAVSFQIPIGLSNHYAQMPSDGLVGVPLEGADISPVLVHLVSLKGRTLPVAAAKFNDMLVQTLNSHYPDDAH